MIGLFKAWFPSKWLTVHTTDIYRYQEHSETGQRRAVPRVRRNGTLPHMTWLSAGRTGKGYWRGSTYYGPAPITRDEMP